MSNRPNPDPLKPILWISVLVLLGALGILLVAWRVW